MGYIYYKGIICREKRFPELSTIYPGPAQYNVEGTEKSSKIISTFNKAKKDIGNYCIKPGPTTYMYNLNTLGKTAKATFGKVFK